jgi:AcrR family transcriptional regulator
LSELSVGKNIFEGFGNIAMGKRQKKTSEATRDAILQAAAKVVGRLGYAKASIARIAEEANVSHGLIYLYFVNQQDLFDRLLPYVGEAMLRYIRENAGRASTVAERERLGLNANFEYLNRHPALHRILNEAAFFAPEAHQVYLKRMSAAYTRSLRRGHDAGEIEGYDADELEILAVMMIGAREYLLERYMAHGGQIDPMPEKVRRTYLKAVARSLGIDPNAVLSGQVKRDDVADRAERA